MTLTFAHPYSVARFKKQQYRLCTGRDNYYIGLYILIVVALLYTDRRLRC